MFLPAVPGFLLKIALGELSSILLEGSRASNVKLLGTGFTFRYDTLAPALKDCLEQFGNSSKAPPLLAPPPPPR